VAVWVAKDPQCQTIIGNRRANEFYEAREGENVSASTLPEIRRFFNADGRELAADELPMQMATATNQDVRDVELHVQMPSGHRIVMLGNAVPLRDEVGQVRGCIGAFMDITDRKQAEKALKRLNEELELRVRERTAELEQAVVELKRSNEDLQQFAYVSSHDLQEPLRMVASYVGLLESRYKDRLDEHAREFIGYAVEGAKRMQGLIKDLLEYSRIQSRGNPFAPVDCERLLAAVENNLQVHIQETGAIITHDPLPTVTGDKTQLMQVFQNLIDNALKFRRPDQTPRVHISAQRRDHEWCFNVRDNGIGIDPQFHDRIFVIFQRLHTRRHYAGSGIGLAIVKRIIERHGGEISVTSEPGHGTPFHFYIKGERRDGK